MSLRLEFVYFMTLLQDESTLAHLETYLLKVRLSIIFKIYGPSCWEIFPISCKC